jgi:carbonic anhydrase
VGELTLVSFLEPIMRHPTRRTFFALAAAACVAATGCHATDKATQPKAAAVTTADIQKSLTPEQAIDRLMTGNERFVAGSSIRTNRPDEVRATAAAQYPYAVVLGCIDSRCPPEVVFDTALGDIFTPRIAGNFANQQIIGSMEFATKVAGAKAIVVVGHESCGAVKGAVDQVKLGNLTSVLEAIEPAAAAVKGTGERSSKNEAFVQQTAEENVRQTVAKIRSESEILRDLEKSGKLKIVGAMQDLDTGRVALLE